MEEKKVKIWNNFIEDIIENEDLLNETNTEIAYMAIGYFKALEK